MNRISHIEGLRFYLAFWVVIDHVLGASGYSSMADLSSFWKVVRSGSYAVDIFVLISGFVIFVLLDNRRESYLAFVTRRFFRLWPLFILLFLLSIPASILSISNIKKFAEVYPQSRLSTESALGEIFSNWEHIGSHVALHVPMLHGAVPHAVLPYSPQAFLGPAWSISLEWQFYLIAPFVFGCLLTRSKWAVPLICLACILAHLGARKLPFVEYGAFLPMHIEYFFIGGLSYFAYKWLYQVRCPVEIMPIGFALAVFLMMTADRNLALIPFAAWLIFFGLLSDVQAAKPSLHARVTGWFFDNRVAQYLGKISYSLYLSHSLVIIVCQAALLAWFPFLTQQQHFMALTATTCVLTIVSSHFLFDLVEAPGQRLGKLVCNWFASEPIRQGAQ